MNPIPSPPATLSDHNSTAAENFSGGSSFEVVRIFSSLTLDRNQRELGTPGGIFTLGSE